jgi:hypothetical protein
MAFPSFPIQGTEDLVAIFDQNFNQIVPEAKIAKVDNVGEEVTLMEHPLETGETITDHAIVKPVEIQLQVFTDGINLKNTYSTLKNLFKSFALLTIRTKTDIYENQIISSMPHTESSDMYDAIIINLKLKEAFFVQPQYGSVPIYPKSQKHSSTVDRGNQNGTQATPRVESSAHDLVKKSIGDSNHPQGGA